MNEISKKRCARCGKRIKKGGACYRFSAEIMADFDGYINITPNKEMRDSLREIEMRMKELSEKELLDQVHKEFEYLVCLSCRDDIDNFLQPGDSR